MFHILDSKECLFVWPPNIIVNNHRFTHFSLRIDSHETNPSQIPYNQSLTYLDSHLLGALLWVGQHHTTPHHKTQHNTTLDLFKSSPPWCSPVGRSTPHNTTPQNTTQHLTYLNPHLLGALLWVGQHKRAGHIEHHTAGRKH